MPYCPACQQESPGPDSRCPLDRCFYVVTRCPHCAAEVLPKEHHCGACGERLEGGAVSLAADLAPASAPARLAATLLDGLALLVVYEVWLSFGWGSGPEVVALLACAWWGLLSVGAGQTLGQHVFGQVVLTDQRRPLSTLRSCTRVLATVLSWPLLGPAQALFRADGATRADLWTSTRTWSESPPPPAAGPTAETPS